MVDTVSRSVAKTFSFRVVATVANFVFAWVMTGNIAFATSLFIFQWTVVLVFYYVHERLWTWIKWGQR
jgi:uncharacterized membrane protein